MPAGLLSEHLTIRCQGKAKLDYSVHRPSKCSTHGSATMSSSATKASKDRCGNGLLRGTLEFHANKENTCVRSQTCYKGVLKTVFGKPLCSLCGSVIILCNYIQLLVMSYDLLHTCGCLDSLFCGA